MYLVVRICKVTTSSLSSYPWIILLLTFIPLAHMFPHISYIYCTLLEFWELCEHAQYTRYWIWRYIPYYYCFPEHFTSIPFYFVVYSIYTRACTIFTHPFASVTYRDNRKSHSQSCPDHANSRSLLIRFQHTRPNSIGAFRYSVEDKYPALHSRPSVVWLTHANAEVIIPTDAISKLKLGRCAQDAPNFAWPFRKVLVTPMRWV